MESVVFIIGGNQGDRLDLIYKAKIKLQEKIGVALSLSSIYKTKAWGKESAKDYLNQVLVFKTDLTAENLLAIGHEIENQLGRERSEKWGDRSMDIDILYIGQAIINTPYLQIPHPLIQLRRFVLVPLVEVLPDFIHPIFKMTNKQLLENCQDTLGPEDVFKA